MTLPTHMIGKVFRLGQNFELISETGHYGEPGMLVRIKDVEFDPGCLPDEFVRFTADFGV
ncbi:hypothetical protein [Salipiger mucosus]|uniref:Uncharacterized protein n=1 Tax=Salipiger mucosus DSM 16094 TaxID=1123237 RepID=S9Q5V0_9RHOB|nr:hypothetical protein [Salipiger mucosus]EPX76756.1 hypothetical protein Salmuc_04642 [Salipiger mucosus DSM 16094]